MRISKVGLDEIPVQCDVSGVAGLEDDKDCDWLTNYTLEAKINGLDWAVCNILSLWAVREDEGLQAGGLSLVGARGED